MAEPQLPSPPKNEVKFDGLFKVLMSFVAFGAVSKQLLRSTEIIPNQWNLIPSSSLKER